MEHTSASLVYTYDCPADFDPSVPKLGKHTQPNICSISYQTFAIFFLAGCRQHLSVRIVLVLLIKLLKMVMKGGKGLTI